MLINTVFGWKEIVKREVLKRGKGEKVSISIVCNEERERDIFHGLHTFTFLKERSLFFNWFVKLDPYQIKLTQEKEWRAITVANIKSAQKNKSRQLQGL